MLHCDELKNQLVTTNINPQVMSREIKSSRAITLKINKIHTNVTSDESLIETNLNLCMPRQKNFLRAEFIKFLQILYIIH